MDTDGVPSAGTTSWNASSSVSKLVQQSWNVGTSWNASWRTWMVSGRHTRGHRWNEQQMHMLAIPHPISSNILRLRHFKRKFTRYISMGLVDLKVDTPSQPFWPCFNATATGHPFTSIRFCPASSIRPCQVKMLPSALGVRADKSSGLKECKPSRTESREHRTVSIFFMIFMQIQTDSWKFMHWQHKIGVKGA